MLFNFSASFAIIIFYGSLLLDDDMTSLSTVFIKILYILEFISVLSLEYDVKKGNWFIFLVNLLFVVTIIVTRSKNNVKNITSILNKKRKFRGYNKIISFVKSIRSFFKIDSFPCCYSIMIAYVKLTCSFTIA